MIKGQRVTVKCGMQAKPATLVDIDKRKGKIWVKMFDEVLVLNWDEASGLYTKTAGRMTISVGPDGLV